MVLYKLDYYSEVVSQCVAKASASSFFLLLLLMYVINRDVNESGESRVSIFFLDPGKGISRLPRIETDVTARQ